MRPLVNSRIEAMDRLFAAESLMIVLLITVAPAHLARKMHLDKDEVDGFSRDCLPRSNEACAPLPERHIFLLDDVSEHAA